MPEIGIEALKRKQAEDLASVPPPVRAAATAEPPRPAPAKGPPKSGARGERAARPDRVGKKMVTAYLPAEQVKALRHLAVDRDTTVQALIEAAVGELLADAVQGRPTA